MAATYFTCTLGQAEALGLTNKAFKNINHFIDAQAASIPDQPAVGFALPSGPDVQWQAKTWTFGDVREASSKLASFLQDKHASVLTRSKTVALICPSTPEFLFTWLALMRLGHPVLLLAPQCQPSAIAHLCKACDTTALFHDPVYAAQSREAADIFTKDAARLDTIELPFAEGGSSLSEIVNLKQPALGGLPDVDQTDVAYLHHTSGTSSGVPKPIPQTHRAGAGVLPSFAEGKDSATFTTTPLYHGGVADVFRAWTSGALIWLFPGKGIPITASNVIRCLDSAREATKKGGSPPVKYFSSVPYVLQMMEADERGFKYLQSMDIVGVGGAALPAQVGDRMVDSGINLISRFGSAECGFLMSSHREYAKDKGWQYLRSNEGAEFLGFEQNEDGLAELVVKSGWPHMAKRNRDDGSFATADLFAPHASVPNAWTYHSRADSQLTLITGKKFDPAPLEGTIATSELLDDALIFGNTQPFPGVLLFRSGTARSIADPDLVDRLWPAIEKLNSESQDHARIPRKMLVPMPVLEQPLEKSSKGTVIRGAVEARFAAAIDRAYTDLGSFNVGDVPDERVPRAITEMIESITAKKGKLAGDTDLFSYGVDSVAGMQVRYGLRQLLPPSSDQLPLNVVEDCGTVDRLAEYIIKQRHGEELAQEEDERKLMLELVDQYSNFDTRTAPPSANGKGHNQHGHHNHNRNLNNDNDNENDNDEGDCDDDGRDVIVLTGATGALGAHILALCRGWDSVKKVYCLVRGEDPEASTARVNTALEQRGLGALSAGGHDKVEVLPSSLGDEHLGLSTSDYARVAQEVTMVMHVAWSVNFRMRLRSFAKDNIASVTNLINLALRSGRSDPARFAFCSSVASVMSCRKASIPEEIVDDPAAATNLGYSRSKWVAEQICAKASEHSKLKGRIAVFRVGQLSGDTRSGTWNTKEAWPMMLSSVKLTRTLPALDKETLQWLPVDLAAVALMQGIGGLDGSGEEIHVLHVLNENRTPDWATLLRWLKRRQDFDIVDPPKWVARLEHMQEIDGADHPAYKLLDHWKRAYSHDGDDKSDTQEAAPAATPFEMAKSKNAMPVLAGVKPVDEEYFAKIWQWIDSNM